MLARHKVRTGLTALGQAELRLAFQRRRAGLPEHVLLLDGHPELHLVRIRRPDVVVEPRYQDPPVAPLEPGDDVSHRVQGIWRQSPELARMEIVGAAPDLDLGVEDAAQAGFQAGQTLANELTIRDEEVVGLELVRVLSHESWQDRASPLLLAFDPDPDVERRTSGGKGVLERLQVSDVLAFVVD